MASLLRSLGSRFKDGLDKTFDLLGDSATSLLTKKYPDIEEVFDTLEAMKTRMRQRYPEEVEERGEGNEDDGKWRPMLLTLSLLYKLQRIRDSHASSWYNRDSIFVRDDELEARLMHTFGYYWHVLTKVKKNLIVS